MMSPNGCVQWPWHWLAWQSGRTILSVYLWCLALTHVYPNLSDVALTSDFICGFCGETDEAHQQTLDLVRDIHYSMVFCYPYSMRQVSHDAIYLILNSLYTINQRSTIKSTHSKLNSLRTIYMFGLDEILVWRGYIDIGISRFETACHVQWCDVGVEVVWCRDGSLYKQNFRVYHVLKDKFEYLCK